MTLDSPIKSLSIDNIIFSFSDGDLRILLIKHAIGHSTGKWALPGGWVKYNEDIDSAADRLVNELTGIPNAYLEQLKVFGKVNRYPHERVITIAYFALMKVTEVHLMPGSDVYEAKWFSVNRIPNLIFDHNEIIDLGVKRLQHIVRHEPIGFNLLPFEFTILQLQSLYEAILQTSFDKPNFRRKLLKMKLLIDTGRKQKNVSHRAANLYKFDTKRYGSLKDKGFTFDL